MGYQQVSNPFLADWLSSSGMRRMLRSIVIVAPCLLRSGSAALDPSVAQPGANKLKDPPGPWECQPNASAFHEYCDKYSSPKSFAMTVDCKTWYEWHGDSDSTHKALTNCAHKAGQECYTYDNNGRMCFSGCVRSWPQSGAAKDWQSFCTSSAGRKAWYMPYDCSAYGYSTKHSSMDSAMRDAKFNCEKRTNKMCHIYDDGGVSRGPHCLPACFQLEPEWCWATATAEVASYWNPAKFAAVGDDCTGIECQVASHHTGKDCCGNRTSCNQGNTIDTDFIHTVAGGPAYTYTSGQLSEESFQRALHAGPVIVRVSWPRGGAHFVTVGGHDLSTGAYFLHDPLVENQAGKYQDVSFESIRQYQEPAGRYYGTWNGTVHVTNFRVADHFDSVVV